MLLDRSRVNRTGRYGLIRSRARGIGITLIAIGSLLGAPIRAAHGAPAGPSIAYAAYASVSPNSQGNGVAADHAGNVYVVGTSGDVPKAHVFITKYDPTGSHVLYRKSISAPCGATGDAIAVDAHGNAYITGQYGLLNQFNICQISTDVLVVKLNSTGGVVYKRTIGPSSSDQVLTAVHNEGEAIVVDGSGSVYVTGRCDCDELDPRIPTTPGAFQTSGHVHDAFVLKLAPSGSMAYSTYLGGSGLVDEGRAIAVDSAGDAYVTGSTASTDFPVTSHAFERTNRTALGTGFIVELNPTGTALRYGSYLGGDHVDLGTALALDGKGHIFVGGATASSHFPTTSNGYDRTCGTNAFCNPVRTCDAFGCELESQDDGFVVEIDPHRAGSAGLLYATYFGAQGIDDVLGIAVDHAGRIFIAGRAGAGDFPLRGAVQSRSPGGYDSFAAEIDPHHPGDAGLVFSTLLAGSGDDAAKAIALGKNAVYLTGFSYAHDFPTRGGGQHTWTGKYGAYVLKLAFQHASIGDTDCGLDGCGIV